MKKILYIPFLLLLFVSNSWSADQTAASCAFADINTAIDAATAGDTVTVPAGDCTWTGTGTGCTASGHANIAAGVCINKGINLIGAGSGPSGTNITSDMTRFSFRAIVDDPETFRISGLSLTGSATKDGFNLQGDTKSFRIDNIICSDFEPAGGSCIKTDAFTYGVIDNSQFLHSGAGNVDIRIYQEGSGTSLGYAGWARPLDFGSINAVYIEYNTFTAVTLTEGVSVVDVSQGGRTVFRHNTVHNRNMGNHGTESTRRGAFSSEIYKNDWTNDCGGTINRPIGIRAGTSKIWDNILIGCYGNDAGVGVLVKLQLDRKIGPNTAATWEECDGTNWKMCSNADNVACTADGGCSGGTCDRFFCTDNETLCTVATSVADCGGAGLCTNFLDGVAGDPCRDQQGRTTGQASAPIHEWNNKLCFNATDCTPTLNGGKISEVSDYDTLDEDVDYFNACTYDGVNISCNEGAEIVAYAAFTDPHPLNTTTVLPFGGMVGVNITKGVAFP